MAKELRCDNCHALTVIRFMNAGDVEKLRRTADKSSEIVAYILHCPVCGMKIKRSEWRPAGS